MKHPSLAGRPRGQAGFTLVELMTVVAIIGILAAVAIPAFIKYVRRSKTTEATMNVRKLFDSSVSYYEAEHATRGGLILPKQFARSNPATPPLGVCCTTVGAKCAPNPNQWQSSPTWNALNFSIDDPHYYSYAYVSSGSDRLARFTARANGDLDCDFAYATFERIGTIDQGGSVSGGSGLYFNQPAGGSQLF